MLIGFIKQVLKRPVAVIVSLVVLILIGFFSLKQIDVDYLPKITYPMIKVHIWWRGATADEVETNIAEPVERVIATVDNLDYLNSSCLEGMYTLLVNFKYGVDVDTAYQDVIAAMGRASRSFPSDMDPPIIIKADPSQLPVMQVVIYSKQRDLVSLRDWADNWLTDRISAVNGAAGVEVVGGLEREIRIELDPVKMLAYGISSGQVNKAVLQENKEMFAGRVTVKNKEIIARTMGEFKNLDEIRNVVVARGAGGAKVYLADIARVVDSHAEMRVNTRFNGHRGIKLNILKQAESNTVTVAKAVKEKLKVLKKDMPKDIKFAIVENQGDYVVDSINGVKSSAVLAVIFIILVTYLFLGSFRLTFVMLTALAVTLLATFFLMKIAGFSLNMFSLGGLVVAMGVIIDNSIVVVENVIRHKNSDDKKYLIHGVSEVGVAIIVSTIVFLFAFLPFLFVPGLTVLLFKELALVIAGIVVISLFVALTVTPFLTNSLLARDKKNKVSGLVRLFEHILNRLIALYSRILAGCLRYKWITVSVIICFALAGLFAGSKVGSEFLPKLDDGRVMVKLKMPSGTAVGKTDSILKDVEKKIRGIPEIRSVFTLAGGKVWGLYTYEIANEGELDIQLVPKNKRKTSTRGFIKKIRPLVLKVPTPGGKLSVMQSKLKGLRKIGEQDVEIKVKGSEITSIYDFAKKVRASLKAVHGLDNVNISMNITKPEYRIEVDRAKASAMGIPVLGIAETVKSLINGLVATQYREGSEFYDIRVLVPESKIKSKFDLENMIITQKNGAPVYLKDVAAVQRASGPVEIVREDQVKEVVVRADSSGISVGDAVGLAEEAVGKLKKPSGVEIEMGGQAQMMAENNKTMAAVIGFAALLVFMVLAIQFESFALPFIIMVTIPLSLTGALLALFLFHVPVGATVLIGLVVMMGAIVSQGVVLLSLVEEYRVSGLTAVDALLKAAPLRLRPILMTALTTVFGIMPLALNLGEGGDMLQPMAIAVMGGILYASPILILICIPALYAIVKGDGSR